MARPAFKAFLNLLPVLPALLVAFSCSREEYGPLEEGISHSGSGDGHLVFRAAVPDTKAALPSRDTIIALTENGEKSPLSLKVSTVSRDAEGSRNAYVPFGSDNIPSSFDFCVYSEDGGRAIDTDVAELQGDRWISRKDWSGKISSYTKVPTIHAWYNDDTYGAGWLQAYGKSFVCVLVNTASGYFGGMDDLETSDHIWGYGVYSGLRADNSIVFRHVGAGVCVHCAQAIDMTVSALSIDARLEGIMNWTGSPYDISDIYSEEFYGYGVETLTRSVNTSLQSGNTWLVSRDEPIILPPQFGDYEGYYLALHLTVSYNGHEHTLDADISDIMFYSGSMTTLEVAMDSFLWIDAPDAACVWALIGEGAYASDPATATITTNISSSDFANRAVDYAGRYCALSENADPARLAFTPRWNNFTDTDWTENYTVSCSGVSSSGTVTVEGGHASWGIESWNVPRYLFLGRTYDTDVRVRDINTNAIYLVAPFLMDWNYSDDYISIANGIITPVAQTPSVQTLEGTVNAGGSSWTNSFSAPYEVITPFLYCNPLYMEFAANQVVRTAVTGISRELRDTVVDGRRLWLVPDGVSVTFDLPADTNISNIGIEYYSSSEQASLAVGCGSNNYSIDCSVGHNVDMEISTKWGTYSSVVVTPAGGDVAVDIPIINRKLFSVNAKHTWVISNASDWIKTWPSIGKTQGSTSTTISAKYVYVVVLPNTTGQARGGYITLSTTDGSDLTATITVTQAAGSGWDFGGGSGWGTGGGTEVGF